MSITTTFRTLSLSMLSLLVFGVGTSRAEQSSPGRILDACSQILAAAKESHYQHTTHVDEAAGVYDVDCSGLLCYVLKKHLPKHYAAIPSSKTHRRPLALQFYEAFTGGQEKTARYWKQIRRMKDAMPGDVIVWRKAEQVAGKDTGHVMIIDQPPVEDGHGVYRVTVIDSTESPHADDTRKDGATGVGRGTMWFLVDADGHPTGYHWRLRNGKSRDIEIVIGRPIDPS